MSPYPLTSWTASTDAGLYFQWRKRSTRPAQPSHVRVDDVAQTKAHRGGCVVSRAAAPTCVESSGRGSSRGGGYTWRLGLLGKAGHSGPSSSSSSARARAKGGNALQSRGATETADRGGGGRGGVMNVSSRYCHPYFTVAYRMSLVEVISRASMSIKVIITKYGV